MMAGTDYVVRAWLTAPGTHERIAVVDRHGRLAHVTVSRHAIFAGHVDGLVRHRLATLPPHRPSTR